MKLIVSLVLIVLGFSSYAQRVDRVKIEESGYSMQRFSNQMKVGLGLELTAMSVSIIYLATADKTVPENQAKQVTIATSALMLTGIIVQMSALSHSHIAGTKLEVADSGVGVKFRF